MSNEPETNEEVGGEEVAAENPYEGLSEIQQALIERQGTTLEEPESEAEEGVDEGGYSEPRPIEELIEEPDHLFETEDGTKVTLEDAKAGYLRQADYTKKTQAIAEERKKIEKYSALLAHLDTDPEAVDMLIDRMRGVKQSPQQQQEAQGLQVPENYKGDPFVEQIVPLVNELRKELAEVKGGQQTMQQTDAQRQQKAEVDQKFHNRFMEGYKYLEGKIGTLPTPKEFEERIIEYVKQQEDPQGVAANIISTDPNYIRAVVDWAYEADINATQSDKVNSAEEERRKRTAKGASLRVAGKTADAPPPKLPKDSRAALAQILDEQQKLARPR